MEVEAQIVEQLTTDSRFSFIDRPKYLEKGICPDCNQKQLFISKSKPYVLKCNRQNHCAYEENTRDIYPEVFQSFSKLYPPTQNNSQATADAYLQFDRQFNIEKIKHWYSQESYRLRETNEYVDTVRFYIDKERTRYWERLIDKAKADGQRFNFGGKRKSFPKNHELHNDYDGSLYKGEWWKPDDITIKKGDTVYLVEGILHALGLFFSNRKSAAILGASNFPSLAIRPYLDLDITWRLALDDDRAGRTNMLKHAKKLKELNQKVEFVLTGEDKKDWDDLYRSKRITDRFIEDSLYRGRLFGSESVKEKAYHWYCKTSGVYTVLDFNNRYFQITVDMKRLNSELFGGTESEEDNIVFRDAIRTKEGQQSFRQCVKTTPITNCKPVFLYCEQHYITGELAYFFNVSFPNMPDMKIQLSGSALESPAAFNKSLLNRAPGAGFDGSNSDFKTIKEQWFNYGTLIVKTLPFLGYDKISQAYIFNEWGFLNGKPLKINNDGFFETGKHRLKSTFKSIQIEQSNQNFSPDWLSDFAKVFSSQGMVSLAFWLGSLFAQQIRAELKSFPFFELTGDQGAGKSTVLEFLWKLLGRDEYEGIDPGSISKAARSRYFSQLSNMPVVLIEADGHEKDKAKQGAFDFESLKTAFNGRPIRSIASFNRGNDVEEAPFNGTIVISQNAQVEGTPALMTRIVHCHCTKEHFTQESKILSAKFEKATTDQFANFLPTVLEKETEILDLFFKKFDEVDAEFTNRGTIREPRIIKTHSMAAAMASCLSVIFPSYTDAWDKRLREYIYSRAEDRQTRLNADHPIVQKFWEIYDFLNTRSESPLGHSIGKPLLNHSANDDFIAINLIHFDKEVRENKIEPILTADLRKFLPTSKKHPFVTSKNVKSKIRDKAVYCLVFKKGEKV